MKGESIDTRFELYDKAFNFFSLSPIIGNGIGSFGLLLTGNESSTTPHNIVLEILSELGIIGFIIFSTFSLVLFLENRGRFLFKMLALFTVLNILKSYGFHDLRLMFGILAVAIAYNNLDDRVSR